MVIINDKTVESVTTYFKDDLDLVRKSFIRFTKDKYDVKAKKGKKKNQNELKSLSRSISKAVKNISKETDENVRFEITNKNIAARARTQAIHEIITNLKAEIDRVSATIKEMNKSIKDLERENPMKL